MSHVLRLALSSVVYPRSRSHVQQVHVAVLRAAQICAVRGRVSQSNAELRA